MVIVESPSPVTHHDNSTLFNSPKNESRPDSLNTVRNQLIDETFGPELTLKHNLHANQLYQSPLYANRNNAAEHLSMTTQLPKMQNVGCNTMNLESLRKSNVSRIDSNKAVSWNVKQ